MGVLGLVCIYLVNFHRGRVFFSFSFFLCYLRNVWFGGLIIVISFLFSIFFVFSFVHLFSPHALHDMIDL